jgi:hypothetical protein
VLHCGEMGRGVKIVFQIGSSWSGRMTGTKNRSSMWYFLLVASTEEGSE